MSNRTRLSRLASPQALGRWLLLWLLVPLYFQQPVNPEEPELRITAVDTTDFPLVGVRFLASDGRSAALPELTNLALRENGVPIPDFTMQRAPVGVDVVFVLDANATFEEADETGGLSRRDKTREILNRFAEGYMSGAALDRVSVIAPDEAGAARFLIQEAIEPAELASAVAGDPLPTVGETPLQEMLDAALDHLAAQQDEGRYQAVLLLTDGARLDRQLDYAALTAAAQEAHVPIYVAILGRSADPEEVAAAERLYRPTRATYVHAPQPDAVDPIYDIWQGQRQQPELRYRSLQRQSGSNRVAVNLGNLRADASFDLTLEPPQISLDSPVETIRRVGSAPDTPLSLLQPAVQPLTATVTRPDGRSGPLRRLEFLVNGENQLLPADQFPDENGQLIIPWNISELDAGTYELILRATDELGFSAESPPLRLTIAVDRPSPPTPTVAPTRAPVPVAAPLPDNVPRLWLLAPALSAAVLAGFILILRRRRAAGGKENRPAVVSPGVPASGLAAGDDYDAILERLDAAGEAAERYRLTGTETAVGRDPAYADFVIDDESVGRFHARLRRQGNGYWLYDEGGAAGVFLNHERLGLAPRPVQHGDLIHIGRAPLRFVLELRSPEPATGPVVESGKPG